MGLGRLLRKIMSGSRHERKQRDVWHEFHEWQAEHAAIIKTCRKVQASIRETRKLAEAIMQREKEHPDG